MSDEHAERGSILRYIEDDELGWGVVKSIETRKTEVYFPRSKIVKKYLSSILEKRLVDQDANVIRALNDQFKAHNSMVNPKQHAGQFGSNNSQPYRLAKCYECKHPIDNDNDFVCSDCGWIICPRDGACGCGYGGPF